MFRNVVLLLLTLGVLRCKTSCSGGPYVISCTSVEDLKAPQCPTRLMFSASEFFVLRKSHLDDCKNLTDLDVRDCLTGLEDDCFISTTALTHLSFYQNKLHRISRGWFTPGSRISYLSFTKDGIEGIDPHAFRDLEELKKLLVTRENLTTIERFVFSDLGLEVLTLSRNGISNIEHAAFENLTSLRKLHLDHNELSSFIAEDTLVNSMEKLEILWLHFNLLTQLNEFMLRGLRRLRILNVSYNRIAALEPATFASTPDLEILMLKDNRLTTLASAVFPEGGLVQLKKLYIDNNRLTYLKSNVLHKLRNLRSVVLGGNPWQCKCLDHILRWMGENGIQNACDKEYMDGKRPVCIVSMQANDECTYREDSYFYSKYSEALATYPPLPLCL